MPAILSLFYKSCLVILPILANIYNAKNPMRLIAFLFFLLVNLVSFKNRAASYYDYDDNCQIAYINFMALHFEEGNNYITAEKKAHPNNRLAAYIEDYADCIPLLMNCDEDEYKLLAPHFDERIKILENGDVNSPWYRFCIAGIYLHKAIINIRFGEQYKAALNFRRSFTLLEDNERLFPQFEYDHVFTGLEEAVVGALPGSYKWIASVFGLKGDVKQGTQQLTTFINTHSSAQPIYAETVLYYAFARFYLLSEQKETWAFLNSPAFSTQSNLLNTFAKVNIALDYRKSDAAIETLQTAASSPDYSRYPIFDYQFGCALLTRLDSTCTNYFYRYQQKTKSDLYIKDTWQKMAFAWYANGNMNKATYCMNQVSTRGAARLDADKQALRFAKNKTWPLKNVLQARLLIDGGYSDKAIAILRSVSPAGIKFPADKSEYFFRLGRAYQAQYDDNGGKENFTAALNNYTEAVTAGKGRPEQYAARAALQAGKMFEQVNMAREAREKYNECLDMPDHDFQNSIDQQAKAGLNRLEGK